VFPPPAAAVLRPIRAYGVALAWGALNEDTMIASTKFSLTFLVFSCLSIPSIHLAAQAPSPHVSLVSDWTRHHVLFRESKDPAINEKHRRDPRWIQAWYERHPQAQWPGYHRKQLAPAATAGNRDWNVPLGAPNAMPYFTATYDGSLSFALCCGLQDSYDTGSGTVSAVNLGNGSWLATQGSITVTATANENYAGTYALYPSGPNPTLTYDSQYYYDNLIYPGTSPALDSYGLDFMNAADTLEVNVRAYPFSRNNYEYRDVSAFVGPGNDNTGTILSVNMNAAPNPGGGETFPAKYVFNVTTVPSCTNDFVVIGIPAIPTPPTTNDNYGQANIVGFNNLYSNPEGTGHCPGYGPTVMFAYRSGTGQVPASVTLSTDGTQLAYIENLSGSSYLHVLTIGTSGSNGSSATAPALPGSAGGNNAIDQKVLLSPDGGTTTQSSTTAAFVDYGNNIAYATTYSTAAGGSGYLFAIANIFSSGIAPAIAWSLPIDAIPSGPVYDSTSNKIFFTDSNGRIDYATTASGSPQVFYGPIVAPGATSENSVIVDDGGQMVYATFNSNGTNAVVVQAPTTLASWVSTPVGAANTNSDAPYYPDFNNAWYTGSGTPLMFVAGTGNGTLPTLYSVGFDADGVMNSSAGGQTAALATGTADSSPVTEFYNTALQKDYLFAGVTNDCIAVNLGGTGGCILSLDITNGFPTVNAASTAYAASGGTTGIVVDNDSSATEASSVYYATKSGGTLVKSTQNGLD
jgi:hypothetical protein